jgi:type III pantothenate kinase
MILELDCGNTLIKWRVLAGPGEPPAGEGIVATPAELVAVLDASVDDKLHWCRLVSVRSDEETHQLLEELKARHDVRILQAAATELCAGVSNGYRDYRRLGLDRWLAILGGYELAGKACLVLDLGTAITADLVDADGRHLGGYICPGLPLMREELRTHTRRIRYDDAEAGQALGELLPGRSTAEAVERGCLLMLRGFVREQCLEAAKLLGEDFEVFLTGGDAGLVLDVWPGVRHRADLVFVGLALACPVA